MENLQRELSITQKTLQLAFGKISRMEREALCASKNAQTLMPCEMVPHMFKKDFQQGFPRVKEYSSKTKLDTVRSYCLLGTKHYEAMRSQKNPGPLGRTVRGWLQRLDFRPGKIKDVCEMLKDQLPALSEKDKYITLGFDEMAITAKLKFDVANMTFTGYPTIKPSAAVIEKRREEGSPDVQLATNALSILIGGLGKRFKTVIGYHLTDISFDPSDLADALIDIKRELTQLGFHVKHVGYDQGPSNLATLKKLSGNEE